MSLAGGRAALFGLLRVRGSGETAAFLRAVSLVARSGRGVGEVSAIMATKLVVSCPALI